MKLKQKIKKTLKGIGPGFITGASDDDPSGIATYSQTGAQFGLSQMWTALFSLPFMIVIQEMCGRIGLITGKGLSGTIREHYSKKILYTVVALLLISNTITIGADLGAMAAAVELITPFSFTLLLLLITVFTLILEIFVSYRTYAKVLKYFALSLLAYIATAFVVKMHWGQVLIATIIPHATWSKEYLLNIVALLGTTISPYLFFWQANEEVEERILNHTRRGVGLQNSKESIQELKKMRLDTGFGMIFSNVITFFIMATAAATLGLHGITDISTAADAATALQPLAGKFASSLFAIGIIGTGLLAVPVLAGSASYAIAETFNWKLGLYKKLSQAHGFYGVITIATVCGLAINYVGIPPFKMLYYAAVLNGLLAPPVMLIILRISGNRKIMGEHTNSRFSTIMGYVITAIMSVVGLALLVSLVI